MAEIVEWIYFKINVPFSVGVRFFPRDPDGVVLNGGNPYVNIKKENLKDFLRANKIAIERGLIIEAVEPSFDFVNSNSLTDEEVENLVKNLFLLKKKLAEVTSGGILGKLRAEAKRQKRSQKIIGMIEDRIAEVTPEGMLGTDWKEEKDTDDDGGE